MSKTKFPMVDVVEVKALDATRIWVRFSDGAEGVRDLSEMLQESGEMVVPLRDNGWLRWNAMVAVLGRLRCSRMAKGGIASTCEPALRYRWKR